MTLDAKAGEQVTCENGHVICEAVQNIATAAPYSSADWTGWTQPEPMMGTELGRCNCTVCGARWVKGPGAIFHFADGWRDARPAWLKAETGD